MTSLGDNMPHYSSSPSMRPRHWKQVLRLAKGGGPVHLLGRGGAFDPSSLEDLSLGQLLGLGLHREFITARSICNLGQWDGNRKRWT